MKSNFQLLNEGFNRMLKEAEEEFEASTEQQEDGEDIIEVGDLFINGDETFKLLDVQIDDEGHVTVEAENNETGEPEEIEYISTDEVEDIYGEDSEEEIPDEEEDSLTEGQLGRDIGSTVGSFVPVPGASMIGSRIGDKAEDFIRKIGRAKFDQFKKANGITSDEEAAAKLAMKYGKQVGKTAVKAGKAAGTAIKNNGGKIGGKVLSTVKKVDPKKVVDTVNRFKTAKFANGVPATESLHEALNEIEEQCKEKFDELQNFLLDGVSKESTCEEIDCVSRVKQAFQKVGGRVRIGETSPTYVQYDGKVGDYSIGGSISGKGYIMGDLNRLAEDLTMAYNVSLGGERQYTPGFIKKITTESYKGVLKESVDSELEGIVRGILGETFGNYDFDLSITHDPYDFLSYIVSVEIPKELLPINEYDSHDLISMGELNHMDIYSVRIPKHPWESLKFKIEYNSNNNKHESYKRRLKESIRRIIRRLNEAEVDPQTIDDTKILRGIQAKIDGRKFNLKNLTPEERDVLSRYGLDAWGYKGTTKMVTPGRNDVLDADTTYRGWRRADRSDKVNIADRARKVDDRKERTSGIANAYVPGKYDPTFDERNDAYVNNLMNRRTSQMKSYLSDRRSAQRDLDTDIQQFYDDSVKRATDAYAKQVADIDSSTAYYRDRQADINKDIQAILDRRRARLKKKIGECLSKLNEAQMSSEDEADTALLRSIMDKIDRRSNARLTPEEQAILDKYGLTRNYNMLVKPNVGRLSGIDNRSNWDSKHGRWINRNDAKINLADRARKLGTRDGNDVYRNIDRERDYVNNTISQDTQAMQNALSARRSTTRDLAHQNARRAAAQSTLAGEMDRALSNKARRTSMAKDKLAKSQAGIDSLLGRNKQESLKEDYEQKSYITTNLDSVLDAAKAEEIIDSILGQISDGMWENSPGQDKYWRFASAYGPDIEVDRGSKSDGGRYLQSGFREMSDKEVLRFFANRLKTIVQEYLNDNNMNPYTGWNEDNEEVCSYIDRHEGNNVTVGDCYKAYKCLK